MYQNDRLDTIIKLLHSSNYISVHKLADELHVSEPTLRRDLSVLEKDGYIIRTRGGAKPADSSGYLPFRVKEDKWGDVNKILASHFTEFIEDKMLVFLDGSVICRQAPFFLGKNKTITVVTNSPDMAQQLTRMGIKTYHTGGLLNSYGNMTYGSIAEESVRRFHFDVSFFDCSSLSDEGLLGGVKEYGVTLLRSVMEQSKMRVLACHQDIIGVSAPYVITSIKDIDAVICDTELPPALKNMLGANR